MPLFPLTTRRLAIGLVSVDLLLVLVYLAAEIRADFAYVPGRLYIGGTNGLAGYWGYAKWLAVVAAVLVAWFRERQSAYLALAAVFLMVWYDDFYEVHEALGGRLAEIGLTRATPALRAEDYGELIGFALLGLLALVVLRWGYRRSKTRARGDVLAFVGLIVLLAVFGVGVDMTGIGVGRLDLGDRRANVALTVAEEGGELVVGSLILAKAVQICRRDDGETPAGRSRG